MSSIPSYLAWLSAGDIAPRTINLRRQYLAKLELKYGPLETLIEPDLVAWLNNPAWGTETKRSALSSARNFYTWALRTGIVSMDPTTGLHRIKSKPGIPRPIPESLLEVTLTKANPQARLMLMLGAYAGMRRSEIAALHSDDVSDLAITVHGKGGIYRTVPIHSKLRPLLEGHHGYYFPGKCGHVEHTYIWRALNQIMPPGFSVHTLRHRFATQAFRGCKDITLVQQLLGHVKVETTLRYLAVDSTHLVAAVDSVA